MNNSRMLRPARGTPPIIPINVQNAFTSGSGRTGFYVDVLMPSRHSASMTVVVDFWIDSACSFAWIGEEDSVDPVGYRALAAGGFYSAVVCGVKLIRFMAAAQGKVGDIILYPQAEDDSPRIPAALSEFDVLSGTVSQ